MRFQLPENVLVTLLRQCYTTPICQIRHAHSIHTSRTSLRLPCLPRQSSASQRRGYHTKNGGSAREALLAQAQNEGQQATLNQERKTQPSIAILGGGITGLSSAHYLAQELPNAKITIYEASGRLGGWLQSKAVNVGNGNVVFESGPRTLRPNSPAGMVTVDMVCAPE